MRLFFFGTLMDRDVMAAVLARPAEGVAPQAASLDGYRRMKLREEAFPVLEPDPAGTIDGILVEPLPARKVLKRVVGRG